MKNKKIMSAVFAILIIFSLFINGQAVEALAQKMGIVTTQNSNLNVRSTPDISSKVIGNLGKNTQVDIIEEIGDWYKIKMDSSYGYVYKKYIKIQENTKTEEKQIIQNKYVNKDKVWKINFNKEIQFDDSIKNEIKVCDKDGNLVVTDIKISDDKKSILVNPKDKNYKLGKEYTLNVGCNIKSTSGLKLKEGKTLKFNIGNLINEDLGLGKYETEKVSNNRDYEWYIDQAETGKYNYENCGPTSATMAIKWSDQSFQKTAEDARNTYRSNGGWWSTLDIVNYLDKYKVKNYISSDIEESSMKDEIKNGNILLLCIDSNYITYNNDPNVHVGRYYAYGGGHFIIVKGYRVVDGKTYFEVYDPNSWYEVYENGVKKGKDRYYSSEDIKKSMEEWWPCMVVISKKDKGGNGKNIKSKGVDIKNIKHMQGR